MSRPCFLSKNYADYDRKGGASSNTSDAPTGEESNGGRVQGEVEAVRARPLFNVLALLPIVLIFTALFIDLAAGRWGAYIRTPIPGLYTPDALLFLGALSVIPNWRYLLELPKVVLATTGLTVLYIVIRFAEAFWSGQFSEAPYLVIRDLAPFGYLALIPAIAIALRNAQFTWLLWTIRIATLVHLVGVTLVNFGILFPVRISIIEPSAASFLEYRGDLQGVIFGIGILAWGSWPGWAKSSRLIQFVFLLGAWQMSSRAALITVIVVLILNVIRERKYFAPWKALAMALASLTVVIALTSITHLDPENVSTSERTDTEIDSGNGINLDAPVLLNPSSGLAKLTGASDLGEGTSGARLATYGQILEFLPLQNFWILGAGPGTDILYEICTGISDAPDRTTMTQNGQNIFLPKCAVDSLAAVSTLRDPHNWTLNIIIHHGIIGLLVFILAIVGPIAAMARQVNSSLPVIAIFAYFVCASFGVILSTPFAMLPISVLLAWLVSAQKSSATISLGARENVGS